MEKKSSSFLYKGAAPLYGASSVICVCFSTFNMYRPLHYGCSLV